MCVLFNTICLCRFWQLSVSNRPALSRTQARTRTRTYTSGNGQSQYNNLFVLPFFHYFIYIFNDFQGKYRKKNWISVFFHSLWRFHRFQFRFVESCERCVIVCKCACVWFAWLKRRHEMRLFTDKSIDQFICSYFECGCDGHCPEGAKESFDFRWFIYLFEMKMVNDHSIRLMTAQKWNKNRNYDHFWCQLLYGS